MCNFAFIGNGARAESHKNLPAYAGVSSAHGCRTQQLVSRRQEDRFNELALSRAGDARTAQLEQIVSLGPFASDKGKKSQEPHIFGGQVAQKFGIGGGIRNVVWVVQ